ncbi:MAG: ribosome maturation factor RimM [Thermodesulfobacteriota bacterium]
MNEALSSDLLLLGRVVKPHGLDGTLSIRSYADSERSFTEAGRVVLETKENLRREYSVTAARPHKKGILLDLDGLDSVDDAEALRDADIYIRRDALKRDSEDEYFWVELIGLEVYLKDGLHIGTLTRILSTGGNDVYVVSSGRKETMIPATREVVEGIDLERNRMIIAHMEGLLDLNEV